MTNSDIIVITLKNSYIKEVCKNLTIEHSDDLTNEVRNKLDKLSVNDIE